MASAQVLPNARKQGHLEAGKKRLEEFRKKKAEGRVKKPASTGQLQSTVIDQYEKRSQEVQLDRLLNSDGVATSERDIVSGQGSPGLVATSDSKAVDSSKITELSSSSGSHATTLSDGSHNAYYAERVQKSAEDQAFDLSYDSGHQEPKHLSNNHKEEEKNHYPTTYGEPQLIQSNEVTTSQTNPLDPVNEMGVTGRNIYQPSPYSLGEGQLNGDEKHRKGASLEHSGLPYASVTSNSSQKSPSFPLQDGFSFASSLRRDNTSFLDKDGQYKHAHEDGQYKHADADLNGSTIFDMGERKPSSIANHEPSAESVSRQASHSLSTGSGFSIKSSSSHVPLNSVISEMGSLRTRPSFLDSLVPRVSSTSQLSVSQSEKAEPFIFGSFKAQNDILASSASQQPFTENVSYGSFDKVRTLNPPNMSESSNHPVAVSYDNEMLSQSVMDKSMHSKYELPTAKQDENFAALEQHIEDLTQEKFSLQRALDASRALAESLATENSSLTDSYNQQGATASQLKSDMERLQEEIKAHLQELDSVRMEYANAQLECNAADERAKILASEVIGLEEKALKLRSSELKLERQLENSNAEIASYKKKVSSLVKERQDLQLTIDALKEEKKLMQSKLRKASGSGKSVEVIKKPIMKDASTSVEDLGVEVSSSVRGESSGVDTTKDTFGHEMQDTASSSYISSTSPALHESNEFQLPVTSAAIPPDQLRTIGNINSLISELALEKEELTKALASESSQSFKLKEMNMELSRKLEAQTQRLELLTAQSMASENIPLRPTDARLPQDNATYTDEGDEVVERVLGWIMKLFPGGPSKRRTSKLL